MATTEVLLYTIVILVILMKLMFWSFYFCLRNRRQQQMRRRRAQEQLARGVVCYEEEPAVPQPAFVFAGLPAALRETALVSSLPEYQSDDPYKLDRPPPSYGDLYNACEEVPNDLDDCTEVLSSDTDRLIGHMEATRAEISGTC